MVNTMNILNMACYGGASAIISFASSVLIVLSQHWHGKHSLDHDLTGVQKFHAIAVPRIGGIAVMTGLIFATLLCFITGPAKTVTLSVSSTFLN